MARSLNDIVAELPPDRQAELDPRDEKLGQEIEGLGELRHTPGKAQFDIAATLNIKQPSVSKIEKQAGMYLSALRSYVEAVGGEVELVVRLPSRTALRLQHLGDMSSNATPAATKRRGRLPSARKMQVKEIK